MIASSIVAAALAAAAPSAAGSALPWQADLGDGTYRNPTLAGDNPDPDVVRVGQDFYLVA